MPTFSIIVPIYNVEKFLGQCIESILDQSFPDYEVILVDDGSPDNCAKICDFYSGKDSRIHVIHKPNGGLVSARKTGLQRAVGKYIICVDGDDYIHKDLLLHINEKIDEFSEPDILSYSYQNVSYNGKKENVVSSKAPVGYYSNETLKSLHSNLLYDINAKEFNSGCIIYSIWSKAIKKDLAQKYQMNVDESITNGEDVAVVIPAIIECSSLYIMDYIGYFYRGTPQSMVHSFKESELDSYIRVLKLLEQTTINEENLIAYGYRVFQAHLIKGARSIKKLPDYVSYCNRVKQGEWVWIVDSYQQPKLRLRNKIGVYFIKKNMWTAVWYLYSRIRR